MQQASGSFRLIVRRGPQPNQVYELNKDVVTLGRDITNDITINDPECSRHHARLTREANGYLIEDLGSTNGTFVNGQRLTGSRKLSPGETIGMGETVTLAYEATAFSSAPIAPSTPPPPAPTYEEQVKSTEFAGGGPEPASPSPYAPPSAGGSSVVPGAPPPQPYSAPYAAPPQMGPSQVPPLNYQQSPQYPYQPYGGNPQAPYNAEYQSQRSGDMMRWVLLGCGCFIVLCVIGAVVGLIVIDTTCAWDDEPIASIVEFVIGEEPTCQP